MVKLKEMSLELSLPLLFPFQYQFYFFHNFNFRMSRVSVVIVETVIPSNATDALDLDIFWPFFVLIRILKHFLSAVLQGF